MTTTPVYSHRLNEGDRRSLAGEIALTDSLDTTAIIDFSRSGSGAIVLPQCRIAGLEFYGAANEDGPFAAVLDAAGDPVALSVDPTDAPLFVPIPAECATARFLKITVQDWAEPVEAEVCLKS